jgi:HB1, ASXL, restriction endonuclease HTH domain
MSTESTESDPYAIVLADLKAQRDRIDQAIQAIESVRVGGAQGGPAPAQVRTQEASLGDGAFHGLSIAEATKKLLSIRKKNLTNTEILAALKAGGMVLTSVDPLNTVGAVLTRRFKETGDIVRVDRGTWGLREWHPGRNWKKEKDVKPEAPKEEAPQAAPKDPTAWAKNWGSKKKATEPESP